MNAKKGLTGFSGEHDPRRSVAALLAEAGLELWQAPEGFWAVRVKPAAMASATPARPRRRGLRGAR